MVQSCRKHKATNGEEAGTIKAAKQIVASLYSTAQLHVSTHHQGLVEQEPIKIYTILRTVVEKLEDRHGTMRVGEVVIATAYSERDAW